jgi:hypothetical protein
MKNATDPIFIFDSETMEPLYSNPNALDLITKKVGIAKTEKVDINLKIFDSSDELDISYSINDVIENKEILCASCNSDNGTSWEF